MADVLRLSIVYETQQVLSGATQLDTRMARLTRSTAGATREFKSGSLAAIHLAQGLASGNVSAVTLARSVEHLGGPVLGGLAVGVGSAAAAMALWHSHMEAQRKKLADFAKEADAAREKVEQLLGIRRSDMDKGMKALTDRIKELKAELGKPGMLSDFWQLLKTLPQHLPLSQLRGIDTVAPQKKPEQILIEQLGVQQGILAASQRLTQQFGSLTNVRGFGGVTFGTRGNNLPTYAIDPAAGVRSTAMGPGAGGLPGRSSFGDLQDAASRAEVRRIVDSWTAGLHTMQDSLEEFLVTGKFVFQQLVDDLLRIAFRAATDDLINKAVNKTIDVIKHHSRIPGVKEPT